MSLWEEIKKGLFSNQVTDLKKQLKIVSDGLLRPRNMDIYAQGNQVYPKFPYATTVLYDLAYNSDVLTAIHNSLRREIFRNGYDLIKAENTDETETSSEQETGPTEEYEEENKAAEETPEDKNVRKKALEFLEEVNENGQSLVDVLMEIEDDFSIADDGFMLFMNDYDLTDEGEITGKELKEIIRLDPRYTNLVMNIFDRPGYDDDNKLLTTCIMHRDVVNKDREDCPQCGMKTYPIYYSAQYGDKVINYMKDEIIFRSKYRPTKRRGFSPIMTVWQKARTLLFMDKYMMQLYDGQRPPKGLLAFKTSNQAGLEKMWNEAKQRAQEQPHLPIVLGVPDASNGSGFVNFIDFMKNLDELQYTEARNEMRNAIGAVYGVSPLFQGDVSQSGGLNNEGLQITVTNRAVQYGQEIYNKYYLPKILEALGIEGYILTLQPSEEQDQMAKLQRQQLSLENGEKAIGLGLDAEYDSDIGEVVIRDGLLEKSQTPSPFGAPGQDSNTSSLTTPNDSEEVGAPNDPDEQSGEPEEFEKTLKASRSRPNFSKLNDLIQDELDNFFKRAKRKPSESELRRLVEDVKRKLGRELRSATGNIFKKVYSDEVEKVEGELGINILMGDIDKNAIELLSSQKVLTDAYDGLGKYISKEIREVITDAYKGKKGLSTYKIKERIKDISDVADYRAENIARTETHKVAFAARKNSYSKEKDFNTAKFKHIGPMDNRTSETCKRIMARTDKGVTWKEYVNIIEIESKKEFPEWEVNKDFPVPHYQCRHVFIKTQ